MAVLIASHGGRAALAAAAAACPPPPSRAGDARLGEEAEEMDSSELLGAPDLGALSLLAYISLFSLTYIYIYIYINFAK